MIQKVGTTVFRLPGADRAVVYKSNNDPAKPSGKEEALQQLKQRDAEVKAHEASHMNSAGVLTIGGPRYTYQIGPDGKPYAIGGKVTLATQPARDSRTAEINARNLKKAALSVHDPSPQDLSAASSAEDMINEARLAAKSYMRNEANLNNAAESRNEPVFNQYA